MRLLTEDRGFIIRHSCASVAPQFIADRYTVKASLFPSRRSSVLLHLATISIIIQATIQAGSPGEQVESRHPVRLRARKLAVCVRRRVADAAAKLSAAV
jgi:hypothetical protein